MLKSLRVSNFKSLRDVTVEFDPVTVLIGKSGTGKSNFLDAIRLLRECLRSYPHAASQVGGWEKIPPFGGNRPDYVGFEVEFFLPEVPHKFAYDLVIRRGEQRVISEGLSIDGSVAFALRNGNWEKKPSLLPKDHNFGRLALPSLAAIPEVNLANVVLSSGIGCYTFAGTVLLKPSDGRAGLADDGTNFLQVLSAISNDLRAFPRLRHINAVLRRLNSSVENVALTMPERNRLDVVHRFGNTLLTMGIDDESEGFRRFLAHLLALYQTPSKQVLAFDEPEKGIYPGALSLLADEFVACPKDGRGQVILATHSPQLLDDIPVESVRVFELVDGETKIGRVSNEQFDAVKENLLSTGELLTADPARQQDTTAASS